MKSSSIWWKHFDLHILKMRFMQHVLYSICVLYRTRTQYPTQFPHLYSIQHLDWKDRVFITQTSCYWRHLDGYETKRSRHGPAAMSQSNVWHLYSTQTTQMTPDVTQLWFTVFSSVVNICRANVLDIYCCRLQGGLQHSWIESKRCILLMLWGKFKLQQQR